MSVTSCTFINSTCQEDVNKYATYKSKWQLITDAKTDGPAAVRAYSGLPQIGDTYSTPHGDSDTAATCIGREFGLPDEKETTRIWHPILVYTTNPGGLGSRDPEDPPTVPWDEPPKISTVAHKDKKAILYDRTGFMIASSAGEPYDPVQEIDDTRYILRIVRNRQIVDLAFNATYRDAINTDVFFGCAPHTVKVETPGTIDKQWFGPIPYYVETWEFSLRDGDGDDGDWDLRLFDYGMYRKSGTELIRICDKSGQPLTAQRLLNGSGGLLAVGSAPVKIKPDPFDPARDYFRVYPGKAFAALNLPNSI